MTGNLTLAPLTGLISSRDARPGRPARGQDRARRRLLAGRRAWFEWRPARAAATR
jgi:hypothetical protein